MNTTAALTVIEREYGGLEEFVHALLTEDDKKVALDDTQPLTYRAEAAGVPMSVFARVIRSAAFKVLLRVDLVNDTYDLEAERAHLTEVTRIAKGGLRRVMSSRGDFGDVDQAPGDIIAAGKYLNDLRGTPVENKSNNAGGGITINIHNANTEEPTEVIDVSFAVQNTAGVHTPASAGGLPPAGVLGRGSSATPRAAIPLGNSNDDSFAALYGESAEEQEEAALLAEKRRVDNDERSSSKETDSVESETSGETSSSGTGMKRVRWPNGRRRVMSVQERRARDA